MELTCIRCKATFDAASVRGYCDDCVEHFREQKEGIAQRQRPAPNMFLDGKFAHDCPCSVQDETGGTDRQVCGLCGSDEMEPGYGLGSGYGIGSYNFCFGCNTFLDFREDREGME